MCDVLPTISEDSISQRSSQFSGGEDANFEQLMVSMLDERDKLMDSLREAQERLNEMEGKLGDTEKERDSLHRQINANLPQVSVATKFMYRSTCFALTSNDISAHFDMEFSRDRFGLVGIESLSVSLPARLAVQCLDSFSVFLSLRHQKNAQPSQACAD